MGLAITAYANVELVKEHSEDIECLYEYLEEKGIEGTVLQVNKHFPLQGEGLVEGAYTYEGAYSEFRCGYGNYSELRNILSKLAGNKPITKEALLERVPEDEHHWYLGVDGNVTKPYQWSVFNKPETSKLSRLIHFSDCEGVINNESCKLINEELGELISNMEKLIDKEVYLPWENLIKKLYQTFKFAADNKGVVEFH